MTRTSSRTLDLCPSFPACQMDRVVPSSVNLPNHAGSSEPVPCRVQCFHVFEMSFTLESSCLANKKRSLRGSTHLTISLAREDYAEWSFCLVQHVETSFLRSGPFGVIAGVYAGLLSHDVRHWWEFSLCRKSSLCHEIMLQWWSLADSQWDLLPSNCLVDLCRRCILGRLGLGSSALWDFLKRREAGGHSENQ